MLTLEALIKSGGIVFVHPLCLHKNLSPVRVLVNAGRENTVEKHIEAQLPNCTLKYANDAVRLVLGGEYKVIQYFEPEAEDLETMPEGFFCAVLQSKAYDLDGAEPF